MLTVSATDLARNTREILDKVASQGESITIERNHTTVAKIIPPERIMTAHQALASLVLPTLTPLQASEWLRDSKQNFGEAVHDPWA